MALVTLVCVDSGDGAFEITPFAGATDAVAHAVQLQSAPGSRSALRVGIVVGEEDEELAELAGELCRQAAPGQVLVSDVVRSLVGPRRQHEFRDAGPGVAEVVRPPAPAAAAELPAPLESASSTFFVARSTELERLRAAWKDAVGWHRQAVLLSGPAGVGKTRLAAEAAKHALAGDDGATVLYGRCEEELGVPYQPFVEALNAYVRACPPSVLREQAGARAADLVRMMPDMAARVADIPAVAQPDPDAQRYLMFEAVVELLGRAGAERPVLLVLDDLHWATRPTVLLLRHILRADTEMRLLVIGTYRDDELGRSSPLADALGDFRRLPDVERVALRGLDRDGAAAYVAAAAGHDLDERGVVFSEVLHAETDGNPFYMGEVLNHLSESGVIYQEDGRWTAAPEIQVRDIGLPESVRDVIGRRISRLSEGASRALTIAAVIGPTFDFGVLQGVPDAADDADALLDVLEEAMGFGLIEEEGSDRYHFSHALIRQTILSGLTSARRARLHKRVGEAIEARPDADDYVGVLAYHFAEAVGGADIVKAADYAARAAERALYKLAHEEAVTYIDRGLHALDLAEPPDLVRRADLWLLRAAALQDGPGEDPGGVIDAVASAADDAREAGAVDRLVRAAEILAEETVFGGEAATVAALCEEALALVSERGDSGGLRARLLASFAYSRATAEGCTPELERLATNAVDVARVSGDEATLVRALVARGSVLAVFADADGLEATGHELADLARRGSGAWPLSWGHRFVGQARLQRGDVAGFDRARAELTRLGRERRHTTAAGWAAAWAGMRAMMDGRLDDVEAHTTAIVTEGGTHPNYANAFTAQLFYLRREQGRLAEIEPVLRDAVAANPGIVGFRIALAVTYVELGELAAAREQFELVAADGFASVPRDLAWSGAITLLTHVCASLGDDGRAPLIEAFVRPFAGQLIVAATGVACAGAADGFLGMLALTQGRTDEARALLQSALDLERAVAAPRLVARTEAWLARV